MMDTALEHSSLIYDAAYGRAAPQTKISAIGIGVT